MSQSWIKHDVLMGVVKGFDFEAEPGYYRKRLYDELSNTYYKPVFQNLNEVVGGNLRRIHEEGNTGQGVKYAFLDSGVMQNHPMIRPHLHDVVNFTEEESAEDLDGHGTMVALATLAVAPSAKIYCIKVLNSKRLGTEDNLIKGLKWCVDNNMEVVNLSLGSYNENCKGDCNICLQAEEAAKHNVWIVAAAGNTPGITACPARASFFGHAIIAVGVIDAHTGKPTSYSGKGTIYTPSPIVNFEPI